VKKKQKARPSITARSPVGTPSSVAFPLLRVFVLAGVGVWAAAYGLWRYYTVARPSMIAPAPTATEIPIEVE